MDRSPPINSLEGIGDVPRDIKKGYKMKWGDPSDVAAGRSAPIGFSI